MSKKTVLYSYKLLDNQAVSANTTSNTTSVAQLDKASIDLRWSASTLAATVEVQAKNGPSGDWRAIDMGSTITISGASGSHELIFNELPFTDLRLYVAYSSGSGTVDAVITAKSGG